MIDPKFKVIAELRNDLTEEQRENAIEKIKRVETAFKIANINKNTYCKDTPEETYSDCGAVLFFYFTLRDMKEYFSKLEYYDLWDGESSIAV